METIIINAKNSSNAKFILELAIKLGEKGKVLSSEDQEDFLLGALMKKEKTGIKVSKASIIKKLRT